jgi:DNA repair exonuclease SbcCD nuclease subunit
MTMTTINENKVAVIGDIHIGVNKNSDEFFEITKDWMEHLIAELESRKIGTLFVLGDWHHYRDEISVKTLDFSALIMKMIPKSIKVHLLTGNHDCYLRDTSDIHSLRSYNEWDNVFIYDTITKCTTASGKTISIVPWGCDIADVDKSDYIFGHFEIQNFKWNSFSICEHGLKSSYLLSKGMNVYSGHFHKFQHKDYKKGSIKYVGSPFQHNFNDVGNDNGFHILELDTGKCEFVINEGFPTFHYIKIPSLKTDLTKGKVYNNFVKLIIDRELPMATIDKLAAKIWSYEPRNLVIDDRSIKKSIDTGDFSVNIATLDMFSEIRDYVDTLETDHKDQIKEQLKKYYENKS